MRAIIEKLKNLSIITIIASAVIGVILLAKPGEALYIVSMLCGITVIILGIGAAISYFAKDRNVFLIILSLIAVITGTTICVRYKSIVSILLFLFGLFITVSSAVDLIASFDAKRNGLSDWIVSFVLSLASLVLGIIVLVNPFTSSLAIIRLLGASLLVYAVLEIIAFIQVRRVAKAVDEKMKTLNPPDVESDGRDVGE